MALDLLWKTRKEGLSLTSQVIIGALKVYSVEGAHRGKQIHLLASRNGLDLDIYVMNSMMDMYAKCGNLEDACKVFELMPYRTVVPWTTLILRHVESGESSLALDLFFRMYHEGCQPNEKTFNSILKACATAWKNDSEELKERCKKVHLLVLYGGFDSDLYVQSTLVLMYSKCKSMEDACKVFQNTQDRDVVSWNSFIMGCVDNGETKLALDTFVEMRTQCPADEITFLAALKACTVLAGIKEGSCKLRLGKTIHLIATINGCDLDIFVQNMLVDMYAKYGSVDDAQNLFDKLVDRNVVSWNAILMGYAENAKPATALSLFARMKVEGRIPDTRTFTAVLKACITLQEKHGQRGKAVHLLASRGGCDSEMHVKCSLVDLYAKSGFMKVAQKVFDSMERPDVVSWTVLMAGYAENGEGGLVLELFARMKRAKLQPDGVTYAAVLKACSLLGALELGREVHEEITHSKLKIDEVVATCLVNFYAKCGSMFEAEQAFEVYVPRDLVAWNAMMAAYSHHGNINAMFHLFERMCDSHLQPNSTTFKIILTACSHAGLVDKGKHYFEMMSSKYSIVPDIDHYTIVIDIFGRANKLEDAMAWFRTMPYIPNSASWSTVLSLRQQALRRLPV